MAHLPATVLVHAAGLLVLGLAAQIWALWSLSARRTAPVPHPAPVVLGDGGGTKEIAAAR